MQDPRVRGACRQWENTHDAFVVPLMKASRFTLVPLERPGPAIGPSSIFGKVERANDQPPTSCLSSTPGSVRPQISVQPQTVSS